MWVRVSVEKDGSVLANSMYEILSGFDIERAARDILRRAIRTKTDRDLNHMTIEEKFDVVCGAAIRLERA